MVLLIQSGTNGGDSSSIFAPAEDIRMNPNLQVFFLLFLLLLETWLCFYFQTDWWRCHLAWVCCSYWKWRIQEIASLPAWERTWREKRASESLVWLNSPFCGRHMGLMGSLGMWVCNRTFIPELWTQLSADSRVTAGPLQAEGTPTVG